MLSKILVQNFLAKRFYGAIASLFEKETIVPDMIDCPPHKSITICYNNGVKVFTGCELTPTQTKERPTIDFCGTDTCLYTLLMTDPDSPSRTNPVFREWHHWLVVNIPGSCVVSGDVLSDYVGPIPPQGAGCHRYVFLIFQQQGHCCFEEPRLSNTSKCFRAKFSTRKFAAKYQLGVPVFGNYFLAQFDSTVPQILKKIGA